MATKDFADMIKYFEMGRLSWLVLNAITGIFIRGRKGADLTQRREEGSVTVEAKTGEMQTQARQCRRSPETGRGTERILPWNLWKECGPGTLMSNFWPPEWSGKTFLLF